MAPSFDLDAYFARIGESAGGWSADLASLRRLHRAHVAHIPFENIDVQAGRGVRIDLESLQRKLVTARRGGYCFEQNTLCKAALEGLGFAVDACEARVRPPDSIGVLPRTHMVLVTRVEGRDWLCDVGFGAEGLAEPVPLDEEPSWHIDREFRVMPEGLQRVLQWRRGGDWQDAYAFLVEPRYPVDFEVGNWYTSTHPSSVFRNRLTAQITRPDARHILRQLTYTVTRPDAADQVRQIPRGDLTALLHDVFQLDVEDDFPGLT
jgi:N-hydroxyarylamine O-acetyltransferase